MIDARSLQPGQKLDCDICIVGGGPAGMTLAAQLAGTAHKIILLDAGSENSPDTTNGDISRDSQFGNSEHVINTHGLAGNANAWNIHTDLSVRSVRFARPQSADLEPRPALGLDGWPITAEMLEPYWAKAASLWKIDPEGFQVQKNVTNRKSRIDFGPDLETSIFQFPESVTLRKHIRRQIERASNITIVTHATVERIDCENDSKCQTVKVRPTAKTELFVEARYIVLAAGCMGNCRIMMSSPKNAGHSIGDASGQLGRYFMDHPLIDGGYLVPRSATLFEDANLYDMFDKDSIVRMGYIELSSDAMQRDALVGLSAMLFPRASASGPLKSTSLRKRRAHAAALSVRNAIERGRIPRVRDVFTALIGIDEVASKLLRRATSPEANVGRGGWSKLEHPEKTYARFQVIQQAEQLPDADNRLYLSDETDALGLRRIRVNCQLTDNDYAQLSRSQAVMRESIVKAGIGSWEPATDEHGRVRVISSSTGHHMGATRMGIDPANSVVDPDLRVHDTPNVFALSTGVFPTGGYANPTFTLTALAVKLAEMLAGIPPVV